MIVKLGQVVSLINGYPFNSSHWDTEGLPVIRIQDLTGNSYVMHRYAGKYAPKYEVNPGDVLISWVSTLGIYVWTGEKAVLSHHIFRVVFDKTNVDKQFFIHQVAYILKRLTEASSGEFNKQVTKRVLDGHPFFLPDVHTQKKIAALLDRISRIVFLQKEQLQTVDQLIATRFNELFSEEINEDRIGNLCRIVDHRGKSPKKVETGLLLITSKNIKMHQMSFDIKEYISADEEISNLESNIPKEGDVLFTTEGPVGKVCRIPRMDTSFYVGQRILTLQTDVLEPVYLEYALTTESFREKILENVISGRAERIGSKVFRQLTIPVPDREKQKQFSEFVLQAEKIKQKIQEHLQKMECLKESLTLQYFSELDNQA